MWLVGGRQTNFKNESRVTAITDGGGKMAEQADSGGTRASLLSRARTRDPAAWSELVDLYAPLVAHWCRRCGLDAHGSADIIQDVFAAVAKSLDGFRPADKDGAFRGWLWTITANKIRDGARRESRHTPAAGGSTALRSLQTLADSVSVPDEEPSDAAEINALVARGLEQIRDEFADKTWRIFDRSVIDGVSSAQVAEEFDVSPATVRQTRSRILRRLREHLGDLG